MNNKSKYSSLYGLAGLILLSCNSDKIENNYFSKIKEIENKCVLENISNIDLDKCDRVEEFKYNDLFLKKFELTNKVTDFGASIFFPSGSSSLETNDIISLNKYIQSLESFDSNFNINLTCYSDPIGSVGSNIYICEKRLNNIKNYLKTLDIFKNSNFNLINHNESLFKDIQKNEKLTNKEKLNLAQYRVVVVETNLKQ